MKLIFSKSVTYLCAIVLATAFAGMFAGLESCKKNSGIDVPDISAIPTLLEFRSEEQLLQAESELEFRENLTALQTAHPDFANFLMNWVYRTPESEADPAGWLYKTFVAPENMKALADTVSAVYPDHNALINKLDKNYRFHRYYFPMDTLKPVFTYSGVFGQPIDMTPSFTAVALPMFLGREYTAYRSFSSENLPRYLLHRLEPEYIPVRIMDAVARTKWSPAFQDYTALSYMIWEGKLLYYLDLVMPFTADSLKIGFTSRQLDWVRYNQEDAWALMVSEDLLFSSKNSDIARLTGEGPNSKGMGPESPSRVGTWIGWQIVRMYMKRNPDLNLHDLFAEPDARRILEESRWKPASK